MLNMTSVLGASISSKTVCFSQRRFCERRSLLKTTNLALSKSEFPPSEKFGFVQVSNLIFILFLAFSIQVLTFFLSSVVKSRSMINASWLSKLGLGAKASAASTDSENIALGPDTDVPGPGLQFATFGGGCFWGVELAYQRLPGVVKYVFWFYF